MWFVREDVSAELGELGRLHGSLGAEALRRDALTYHIKGTPISERWDEMSKRICKEESEHGTNGFNQL